MALQASRRKSDWRLGRSVGCIFDGMDVWQQQYRCLQYHILLDDDDVE